jgi:hypothetical protein
MHPSTTHRFPHGQLTSDDDRLLDGSLTVGVENGEECGPSHGFQWLRYATATASSHHRCPFFGKSSTTNYSDLDDGTEGLLHFRALSLRLVTTTTTSEAAAAAEGGGRQNGSSPWQRLRSLIKHGDKQAANNSSSNDAINRRVRGGAGRQPNWSRQRPPSSSQIRLGGRLAVLVDNNPLVLYLVQ